MGGKFTGTTKNCDSCHLEAFNKTTNPNHVTAGFPKDCAVCHTTTQWKGAKFDHSKTQFPLTGSHTSAQCAQCHVGGKFTGTPKNCDSCHLEAFNKTTNPNHVTAGFPQDCAVCHTTTQWKGAKFDHSKTQFPLTGSHTSAQCAQCHVGGKFTGTPKNCDALPPGGLQQDHESEPRDGGLPAGLRASATRRRSGRAPSSTTPRRSSR